MIYFKRILLHLLVVVIVGIISGVVAYSTHQILLSAYPGSHLKHYPIGLLKSIFTFIIFTPFAYLIYCTLTYFFNQGRISLRMLTCLVSYWILLMIAMGAGRGSPSMTNVFAIKNYIIIISAVILTPLLDGYFKIAIKRPPIRWKSVKEVH